MKLEIPFYQYPGKHGCLPSCLRMAMEYFGEKITWEEMDRIIEKKPDKWALSWPLNIYLHEKGWYAKEFATFDLQTWITDPDKVGRETYGDEIFEKVYLPNYDFESAKKYGKEFLEKGLYEKRFMKWEEIKQQVEQGSVAIFVVNSRMLAGNEGYMGHLVVLTGWDDENVFYHDPSVGPNQKTIFELFWKAHTDKGTDNEIILIKR